MHLWEVPLGGAPVGAGRSIVAYRSLLPELAPTSSRSRGYHFRSTNGVEDIDASIYIILVVGLINVGNDDDDDDDDDVRSLTSSFPFLSLSCLLRLEWQSVFRVDILGQSGNHKGKNHVHDVVDDEVNLVLAWKGRWRSTDTTLPCTFFRKYLWKYVCGAARATVCDVIL